MGIIEHMPIEIYSPHRPSLTCTSAGAARAHLDESGGVAWVWVRNPTDEQVRELGEVFALPEPAISEVINGGQHSKLKQYSNLRFLALHHAQSFDQLGDMYLFIGEDFVIFLDRGEAGSKVAVRVSTGEGLHHTSDGITYLVLEELVNSYEPVVTNIGEGIDDIEDDVFAGAHGVAKRLHEHLHQVLQYQRAMHSLVGVSEQLLRKAPQDLQGQFSELHQQILRESIRIDSFKEVLSSATQVHIAIVGHQQNEEMARMSRAAFEQGEHSKKVASWAAILFTPTVIAGVYGMNFIHMPELATKYGYPIALFAMISAAVGLYVIFKRQQWL